MRETHALCVMFTRSGAVFTQKGMQKGLGMVHGEANGLIMKLRGMMRKPDPGAPAPLGFLSDKLLFCLSI
jgi:hypothetical protein